MKYVVKYGSFVRHRVSCNSRAEVDYCKQQLKLRGIESEVEDLTLISPKEKAMISKSDFSFQRFKKEILK